MKIIRTGPRTTLIGHMMPNLELFRMLNEKMQNSRKLEELNTQLLCETAGRICYDSFKSPRPGGQTAYLKHIIESGHGRILEHAVYAFLIEDISRSCAFELFTHVAGTSRSMRSQRYCDDSEIGFVLPPDLTTLDETEDEFRSWKHTCTVALADYQLMVEHLEFRYQDGKLSKRDLRKKARQAARSILPECTATVVYLTINARSLRNLIEMRCSEHADPEIRSLAFQLYEHALALTPDLFGDYQVVGTHTLTTPYRKV